MRPPRNCCGEPVDWLRADLARYANALPTSPPAERAQLLQRLQWSQRDRDLAGVRDAAALARLLEAEQEAWRKLWAEVEGLIEKAKPKEGSGR